MSRSKKLIVLLIYPNLPEIAYSNLGFPLVAHLFNKSGIAECQMASIDERGNLVPDVNIFRRFDIIAFSISFELDLINVIKFLKKYRIEFMAEKRGYPIFIAGGSVLTLNPEIVADIFDIIFIGEAENHLNLLVNNIFNLIKKKDKRELLKSLAKSDGVYITSLYKQIDDCDSSDNKEDRIRVASGSTIEPFIFKTPVNTIFKKSYLVEAQRGCNMGCKFCFTGTMYKPYKHQPKEVLQGLFSKIPLNSKVALIAPNVLASPLLSMLLLQSERLKIYLSSFRVDHLNSDWLKILKSSDQNSITISIESGSERLRSFINKRIKIDKVFSSISDLIDNGIINIKIYFMVGLPCEDEEDINEMIRLIKEIHSHYIKCARLQDRIGKLTIGISPFIPKPHTPFELYPMETLNILSYKYYKIQNSFSSLSNLKVNTEPIINSIFQGFINRAKRCDLPILIQAEKSGLKETYKTNVERINELIHREVEDNDRIPWRIIDCG